MRVLSLAAFGYFVGSVPFSFLVARVFGVRDVRTVGSGNVGATNVMRSAGKVPGLLALLLDGAKGAATVVLARQVSVSEFEVCVASLFAVIGHLFPVWLGFRGGKGVATGAGLFLPLAPMALGASLLLFALTLAATRYVSLASMVASAGLPVAAYLLGASPTVAITAVLTGALVVARHHQNVSRLLKGLEPRMGARR